MALLEYFSNHHEHFLYLIAGLCFVIELSVIGLSGPLFFFAIAAFLTGVAVDLGLIQGLEIEIFTVGVLTSVITALLWKPLKRFQNAEKTTDQSSDMIGRVVISSSEITKHQGSIRHSGIDWPARISPESDSAPIDSDSPCEITKVDGNTMIVKRTDS